MTATLHAAQQAADALRADLSRLAARLPETGPEAPPLTLRPGARVRDVPLFLSCLPARLLSADPATRATAEQDLSDLQALARR